MNKKLTDSIVYTLASQGNKQLEILRLAKYLYLADYVYAKSFSSNKTFTGIYERQPYGPVPEGFQATMKYLQKKAGVVQRTGNIISLVGEYGPLELEEEEKASLDWVAEHFAKDSTSKVLKVAYETEPMLKMIERENSLGGQKLHMEELDFNTLEKHPLLENDVDLSFMNSPEFLEEMRAS